ncbi:alcohol dehydrogenase [Aspergillus tetrazonus]
MTYPTEALLVSTVGAKPQLSPVILDAIRDDEVLVEIHATGVCHTDIACIEGKLPAAYPCVLGHEGAGVVLETGRSITDITPGDKVLLSYNFCGSCSQCHAGHPAYCENMLALNFGGKRLDGTRTIRPANSAEAPKNSEDTIFANFFGQSSFSRVALVARASVTVVASDTPLDLFAPLGCGIQTGAGAILNTLDVREGSTVAVFGVGAVGLSAIMAAARLRKARTVIAVDLDSKRLALARELGATHTVLVGSKEGGDVLQQIRDICAPANGLAYAVDCSGVPGVIETMLDVLGTRGRAASVGAPAPGKRAGVDVFSHLTMGKEYVGCHQGSAVSKEMLPYLIEQHGKGDFPLDKMIAYYPVEEYQRALEDLKCGRAIKAVLRWKE